MSTQGRRWLARLGVAVIAVALAGSRAEAGKLRYEFTDLGTLPGDDSSSAVDINNAGQVVGGSYRRSRTGSLGQAFVYSDGRMTALNNIQEPLWEGDIAINDAGQIVGKSRDPDRPYLYRIDGGTVVDEGQLPVQGRIAAINDAGQMVGYDYGPNGTHSFLYNNGRVTDLGTLDMGSGMTATFASDINNAGQVVGRHMYEEGPDRILHYAPFVYSDGKFIDLGPLGRDGSAAYAINDAGQVVGGWALGPDRSAFLYADGKVTDLGTFGGSGSEAFDINNLGQIVGSAETSEGESHAFLYQGSTMIDLNDFLPPETSWTLTGAFGINDTGQIIGSMYDGVTSQAFLLTPTTVPEPTPLVVLGTAALGLWARRRSSRHP